MNTRKYASYARLMMRLRAVGLPNAGSLASLFLRIFVHGRSVIHETSIHWELDDTEFFETLREKGVINTFSHISDEEVLCTPGPLLQDIITEERKEHGLLGLSTRDMKKQQLQALLLEHFPQCTIKQLQDFLSVLD